MVPNEDGWNVAFGYMELPEYSNVSIDVTVFIINKTDLNSSFIEQAKKTVAEKYTSCILFYEVSLKDVDTVNKIIREIFEKYLNKKEQHIIKDNGKKSSGKKKGGCFILWIIN